MAPTDPSPVDASYPDTMQAADAPSLGDAGDHLTAGPNGPRVTPLDGLRAFAVMAVIVYHAQPAWAVGGYFGVDVFFVLSGFLITSLLVREWQREGGISLRGFWVRRARRLLPALFLMLGVVGLFAVILPQVIGSPGLLGDTVATIGYAANWHLIAEHTNYFSAVGNPSPLLPTWSLAIEEQFYLVWPLILLALLGGIRSARRRSSPGPSGRIVLIAVAAGIGAVGSALLMALITPVGASAVNRAYYGSDTRAQSLLIGAALAAVCLAWGPVRTGRGRRVLWILGLAGAVGIGVMWATVDETSAFTFHGGFAVVSLGTAAVIAAVSQLPGHPLTKALGAPPLPYVGRISYGMYLWYWPVLLVLTAGRTHLDGVALLGVRLAVIVLLAAASYHLVETPVRRGVLAGWRSWVAVPAAVAAISVLPLVMPSLEVPLPSAGAAASVVGPGNGPPAGVPAPDPIRILLVGDSLSGSLGVGLAMAAPSYGAQVVNRGAPGCSLAEAAEVRVLWYTEAPGYPCLAQDPAHLLDVYRSWVAQFDPDVVVYLARSDTLDTERDGTWQHLNEPGFDRWTESRFEQAVAVLSSQGAHVVFLTSPFYKSGELPDGEPLPENDPLRVATDNRLMSVAAAQDPQLSSVFNLGAMLSPGQRFTPQVDGVPIRCSDGIHLTVAGGQWVGARLLPELVTLGRAHAIAAFTDHRPPLPPQVPPAWYSELPCES